MSHRDGRVSLGEHLAHPLPDSVRGPFRTTAAFAVIVVLGIGVGALAGINNQPDLSVDGQGRPSASDGAFDDSERAFLQSLGSAGVFYGSPDVALAVGQDVCDQLGGGVTEPQLAAVPRDVAITEHQRLAVVTIARDTLC